MTSIVTQSKDQGRRPMVVRAGEAASRTGLASSGDELIAVLDGRAIFDELADLVDLGELLGGAAPYEHAEIVVVERGTL